MKFQDINRISMRCSNRLKRMISPSRIDGTEESLEVILIVASFEVDKTFRF